MQVIPLSEGTFTIGHDKIFVPFDETKDVLTDRPTGSLLVEIQPFLVITSQDYILCDLGLGYFLQNGELQIHQNLRNIGVEPEQITKVLMSHLHKDHAGGVSYLDPQSGERKLMFPDATYYVRKEEYDFAMNDPKKSYMPEELEILATAPNVHWLTEPNGIIDGYIQYYHSGGHSPFHQVFLIEEGNDKVFFGGDEAPQKKQMIVKYVAKYDYDGKRAMELRAQYAEEGRAEGWEFLFYHDVKMPNSKL